LFFLASKIIFYSLSLLEELHCFPQNDLDAFKELDLSLCEDNLAEDLFSEERPSCSLEDTASRLSPQLQSIGDNWGHLSAAEMQPVFDSHFVGDASCRQLMARSFPQELLRPNAFLLDAPPRIADLLTNSKTQPRRVVTKKELSS
jgi:hypothetical protein